MNIETIAKELRHRKHPLVVTLLLIITMVVLSQIRKPAVIIDFDLTVGQASFLVNGEGKNGYRLIDSVSINSIYLKNFKKAKFNPESLVYDNNNIEVNGALTEIKPKGEYPNLKLEGGNIVLVHFDVAQNSKVTLYKYKEENTIDVRVQYDMSNVSLVKESDGVINVGNNANIRIERCLVDRDGRTIVETDDDSLQREFQAAFSSERIVSFVSDNQSAFHIVPVISEEISDLSDMFKPLKVRNIDFNDYEGETKISTVKKGFIKFRNLNNKEIPLGPRDSIDILYEQPLTIVGMGLEKEGIRVILSGSIESLKIGQVEQLPSLLEYLYKNNTLAIIIPVLYVIWREILGAPLLISKKAKSSESDKVC